METNESLYFSIVLFSSFFSQLFEGTLEENIVTGLMDSDRLTSHRSKKYYVITFYFPYNVQL